MNNWALMLMTRGLILGFWLVVGILALVRLRKHRLSALLVLIAAGVFLLLEIAYVLVPWFFASSFSANDLATLHLIFGVFATFGRVFGFLLLVLAGFCDRSPRMAPYTEAVPLNSDETEANPYRS